MTLTARNSVILGGVACAFLLSIICIGISIYAAAHDVNISSLGIHQVQYWWMMYGKASSSMMAWIIPVVACTAIFSAAAGFFLYRFFRKTVSYEIFFFIMFILSISLDAVRVFQLQITMFGMAPYYGVLISRISYMGRFFGTFCIFASSFYAMNIQYQKIGVVLGLSAFVSFTLAVSMPFDITSMLQNLLYKADFEKGLLIVVAGFGVFTVLNYIWAGFLKGMRDYLVVLSAVILVITGRSILFFMGSPISVIAGSVFLISGTILFGKKLHSMYLWT